MGCRGGGSQSLRLLQIPCVEPFGEPAVDRSEKLAGLRLFDVRLKVGDLIVWIVVAFLGTATLNTRTSPKEVIPTIRRAKCRMHPAPTAPQRWLAAGRRDHGANSFQAVPSNFATRADKKVFGESDEVAAAPPCVATAIARWRLRRKGISKQGGTCHGQRSG